MPARTKSRRHAGIKLPGISKHNEGRKPRYKEHGAGDRRHLSPEKRVPEKLIPRATARARAAPDVELTESVRRYLAERQEPVTIASKPPVVEHNDLIVGSRNLRESDFASQRDIVLEMYIDKRLSVAELQAARMWQHYMEEMCLQPPISCDPSGREGYQYQRDGEISQSQYDAMVCRRIAEKALGKPNRAFLDAILQPDIGLKHLNGRKFEATAKLKQLLLSLAVFFGYSRGNPEQDQAFIAASAERLDRKYDSTVRSMENQRRSVGGWHWEFNRQDGIVFRN